MNQSRKQTNNKQTSNKNAALTTNKKTTKKRHKKKIFTLKQLLKEHDNYFIKAYLDARLEKSNSEMNLFSVEMFNYIVIIGCFFIDYGLYFGFMSGVPDPKDVIFFILNFLLSALTVLLVSYIKETGDKPTAKNKNCVNLAVFLYILVFAMSVLAILLFNNNYVHIMIPVILIINVLMTLIFYEKTLAKAEKVQLISTISKDLKRKLKKA